MIGIEQRRRLTFGIVRLRPRHVVLDREHQEFVKPSTSDQSQIKGEEQENSRPFASTVSSGFNSQSPDGVAKVECQGDKSGMDQPEN